MKKFLSPRTHGVLDYVVVAAFVAAPTIFAFGGTPAVICYTLALVHLTLTVLTAYPLGLVKLIPFPAHGQLELIVSIALLAMPWFAGFHADDGARNFFIGAGLVILAVYFTTDYRGVQNDHAQKSSTPSAV